MSKIDEMAKLAGEKVILSDIQKLEKAGLETDKFKTGDLVWWIPTNNEDKERGVVISSDKLYTLIKLESGVEEFALTDDTFMRIGGY